MAGSRWEADGRAGKGRPGSEEVLPGERTGSHRSCTADTGLSFPPLGPCSSCRQPPQSLQLPTEASRAPRDGLRVAHLLLHTWPEWTVSSLWEMFLLGGGRCTGPSKQGPCYARDVQGHLGSVQRPPGAQSLRGRLGCPRQHRESTGAWGRPLQGALTSSALPSPFSGLRRLLLGLLRQLCSPSVRGLVSDRNYLRRSTSISSILVAVPLASPFLNGEELSA